MSRWKSEIRIDDIHKAYKNKVMTIQNAASLIAGRIEKNRFAKDLELIEIINQFKELSDDPMATDDEYDDVLESLYNFGDKGYRIWIEARPDK